MVVPKSFPALCTPYVQVVRQPWKCTVHKSWKCLHRGSVQEVSKSYKKCFVSKSVSKCVLHNSYVITVSKKCPSWAIQIRAKSYACARYLVRLRFRLFYRWSSLVVWRSPVTRFSSLCGDLNELRDRLSYKTSALLR